MTPGRSLASVNVLGLLLRLLPVDADDDAVPLPNNIERIGEKLAFSIHLK